MPQQSHAGLSRWCFQHETACRCCMPACHTTRQDACINAALLSEAGQGTRAPQVAQKQEKHSCCHRVAANHTQLRTQQCPDCAQRQYTRTHADCCARAPSHSSARWHSVAWLARNIASTHAWIHTRPASHTNQSIFSHTLPPGHSQCQWAGAHMHTSLKSAQLRAAGCSWHCKGGHTHTHSSAKCHGADGKCLAEAPSPLRTPRPSSRGLNHHRRAIKSLPCGQC